MADTVLIYGASGLYKTTNAGDAAQYVYELTGAPVRLISTDGSKWKPIQDKVAAGLIEPFHIIGHPYLLSLIKKLAEGWWPDVLEDGLWTPQTRLIPPTADTWKRVGGYIVDGITSMSDEILSVMRDKQMTMGQASVGNYSEKPDWGTEEKFCANSQTHYGFAQREMLDRIKTFGALPVNRVIFVAHESVGEDEGKTPILGPALAGKAATASVPRQVGDCIHFEAYNETVIDQKTKILTTATRVRAFFVSHPDAKMTNLVYMCKSRLPLSQIHKLMARYPGGYFEPTPEVGLGDFLRFEDSLVEQGSEAMRTWKQKIDNARAGGK